MMKFRWLYLYYFVFTSIGAHLQHKTLLYLKVNENYGIGKHLFHHLPNHFLWTRHYEHLVLNRVMIRLFQQFYIQVM